MWHDSTQEYQMSIRLVFVQSFSILLSVNTQRITYNCSNSAEAITNLFVSQRLFYEEACSLLDAIDEVHPTIILQTYL